jgi:uncharacterized membrane protein
MNTSIYKNLYTNVYKPIGSEMPFTGDWQHQVLTDEVGSIFLVLPIIGYMVVKPTTANINTGEKYDTQR